MWPLTLQTYANIQKHILFVCLHMLWLFSSYRTRLVGLQAHQAHCREWAGWAGSTSTCAWMGRLNEHVVIQPSSNVPVRGPTFNVWWSDPGPTSAMLTFPVRLIAMLRAFLECVSRLCTDATAINPQGCLHFVSLSARIFREWLWGMTWRVKTVWKPWRRVTTVM